MPKLPLPLYNYFAMNHPSSRRTTTTTRTTDPSMATGTAGTGGGRRERGGGGGGGDGSRRFLTLLPPLPPLPHSTVFANTTIATNRRRIHHPLGDSNNSRPLGDMAYAISLLDEALEIVDDEQQEMS